MEPLEDAFISQEVLSFEAFRHSVLADYRIALTSREVSLLGRREVLTGKAKFGIFGDGKEVAQVAMSKFFQKGDFRSGYYRDQTFMFAIGVANTEHYFSQLYADVHNDPYSGGKNMNAHFATAFVNENGQWNNLVNSYNISADIAPTAGQMVRGLGMAFASNCFRSSKHKDQLKHLSNNGKEVCFCTIGDASTSEGHFWEVVNAAGVIQAPLAMFVFDVGYGISVPTLFKKTAGSLAFLKSTFCAIKASFTIELSELDGAALKPTYPILLLASSTW